MKKPARPISSSQRWPMMSKQFRELPPNAQRGSKPRCHLLTNGPRAQVAKRLSALIEPWGNVAPTDRWMPAGFGECAEAQLHTTADLLPSAVCADLGCWWLPNGRPDARTPNWDVASTCTVNGSLGLLLIEAKAHDEELIKEAAGRRLEAKDKGDQAARQASHDTIGAAIEEARAGLSAATGLPWRISRDSHYQLSNRFAWSWKLAMLGYPVILVYLGFLKADEMTDKGKPFATSADWDKLVRDHGASVVPPETWNREWSVASVPLVPLLRSVEQSLDTERPS